MKIQRIVTDIDPATLDTGLVTITLELGVGQTVEQAVEAVRSLCEDGRPGYTPAVASPAAGEQRRVLAPNPSSPDLSIYDNRTNGKVDPSKRAPRPVVGVVWSGDGYPPSKVSKVDRGKVKPGDTPYWVLSLEDGSRVKASAVTGLELERKPSKSAEAAKMARDKLYTDGEVTIAATSAQGGPLAPPPGGEPPGVPFPTPSEPAAPLDCTEVDAGLLACATVPDAVEYAIKHELPQMDGVDEFIAWAQRVRKHVQVFSLVSDRRFIDRMRGAYEQATQGSAA